MCVFSTKNALCYSLCISLFMVIRDKLLNAYTHLTKSRIKSIQEHNYKNYLYLFLCGQQGNAKISENFKRIIANVKTCLYLIYTYESNYLIYVPYKMM